MLTTALHWMSALGIALGVHVLGLLWLDPVQSTLPKPNVFSDEIIVMLGEGSGKTMQSARSPQAPDSITKLDVAEDIETEPLTSPTEKSVISSEVEKIVAPSLARRSADLAAVKPSQAADAEAVEHKPESQHVEVSETGVIVPHLTTNEAQTVSTETVAAQQGAVDITPATVEVAQTDDADPVQPGIADIASDAVVEAQIDETDPVQIGTADIPPAAVLVAQTDDADPAEPDVVDIKSPDIEVTTVVSPTQLVRESVDVDAADVIEVEEGPSSEAAETASTDQQVQKAEAKAPDPVVAPAQSPVAATAGVDSAAAPLPDAFESEQPVVAEMEQDIQHSILAAVVLEFETVEATTVVPSRTPAPQVAQSISIEQQIVRALTVNESQGQGPGKGIVARYAGQLKGRLEESMHYPRAARLAGQEGKVVVRFVIDRNGRVLSIVLEKASGHAILDREAVEMIERGEPFPTMPTEMGEDVLELRVPIAYKIKVGTRNKDIPPIYLQ